MERKTPWRLITNCVFNCRASEPGWMMNAPVWRSFSLRTLKVIVFLLFLCQNSISLSLSSSSVFGCPASSPQRRGRAFSKAGLSLRCWQNQDVPSQRDAGVSGWDGDKRGPQVSLALTTFHMHTHIFVPYAHHYSSLVICMSSWADGRWREAGREREDKGGK